MQAYFSLPPYCTLTTVFCICVLQEAPGIPSFQSVHISEKSSFWQGDECNIVIAVYNMYKTFVKHERWWMLPPKTFHCHLWTRKNSDQSIFQKQSNFSFWQLIDLVFLWSQVVDGVVKRPALWPLPCIMSTVICLFAVQT